jgi:hypothetical protein
MTADEKRVLRAMLGTTIMRLSHRYEAQGYKPEEVAPDILAELLALSATIAKDCCCLSLEAFLAACKAAAMVWEEHRGTPL